MQMTRVESVVHLPMMTPIMTTHYPRNNNANPKREITPEKPENDKNVEPNEEADDTCLLIMIVIV